MRTLETDIIIYANIEKVWKVLTLFENYATWNPFIQQSQGQIVNGTKLKNTIHINGTAYVFQPTIVAVKAPYYFAWYGYKYAPFIFGGKHYFHLEKVTENETKLIHNEDFLGLLGNYIFQKIQLNTKKGFIAMNEALKKECEQCI